MNKIMFIFFFICACGRQIDEKSNSEAISIQDTTSRIVFDQIGAGGVENLLGAFPCVIFRNIIDTSAVTWRDYSVQMDNDDYAALDSIIRNYKYHSNLVDSVKWGSIRVSGYTKGNSLSYSYYVCTADSSMNYLEHLRKEFELDKGKNLDTIFEPMITRISIGTRVKE